MKIFIAALAIILILPAHSQITCTNCTYSDTTSYTNGADNDSLFYLCAGQTATLVATPTGGASPWDFDWQSFNAISNTWNALATQNNVLSSTQTNLQPNGYRCQITDAAGAVEVYIVWVVRVNTNPSVNVIPITPGCTTVNLVGSISNGAITPYYNPPSTSVDANSALIVDANTEITVCFSGTHTFVSDLAFHLRGPSSCGSPDITLSPSPGICNGGDNINNLCFTTEPAPNFNVCTAPTPLTGTYDSYGATSTPIVWSSLYGCDASQPGWAVQIWDCVGIDVGSLTDATLTFSGTTVGGSEATYTYTTPAGFNSPINDNSCSASTASIFTVPAPPAVPINFTFGHIWTADPPFNIPNNTSSLNITLNPGPSVDTQFTLTLTGTNPGNICGGTDQDSELYDFQQGEVAVITEPDLNLCVDDDAVDLSVNVANALWTGTGITDPANGVFDPSVSGAGTFNITCTPSSICSVSDMISINVFSPGNTAIAPVQLLCVNNDPVTLDAVIDGGTWSGNGITNSAAGTFDPEVAGVGTHVISYAFQDVCLITGEVTIEVIETPEVNITNPTSLCADAPPYQLLADVSGGFWAGNGVNTLGIFDPSQANIGANTVSYTVPGNCQAIASEVITVYALPMVNAGNDQSICEGDNATLTASGAQNYTWSPATNLSSTNTATTVASPNNSTTYTVTGIDMNGCVNSDVVTVIVNDNPIVTASVTGDNPICQGQSTTLNAQGAVNYVWTPNQSLTGANTAAPVAAPNNTTTYTVTGTDANGCSATTSVEVNVIIVNADFEVLPEEGLAPLTVNFDNNSIGDEFEWDFGNGSTLNTDDVNGAGAQTYENAGTYTVTLTATIDDCSETSTETVFVFLPAELFTIPNVITPNGKDGNEVFFIESTYFETMDVKIYNRWGQIVGTIESPEGKWAPGYEISTGTYYYHMRGVGYDGNVFVREGSITVLRD